MSLTPGTRLGPYEIVAPLGAGGMGEVYRARDTKLDRDVAIKVLPESFALDADRVARFTREAKTLASLNHPNIAAIYGIEAPSTSSGQANAPLDGARGAVSDSRTALVMELVEGEDLSVIIARGAVPFEDALPIAKQIADALEAAHDAGVIHRDLKPANIKVRTDGTVKVLDFGLARTVDAGPGTADLANSPTLTARSTQLGMILGTAAYMSPEQAKGRAVDKRADIWAFGVVLFEMLSGQRAFEGDDISDVLGSVLKLDPNWNALPSDLPAPVKKLLRRCLEKDPKKRLRDLAEGLLQMEDGLTNGAASSGTSLVASATSPLWKRALPWAMVVALAIGLVTALVLWSPWTTVPAPAPRKLLANIGADASLTTAFGPSAILSPDGTTLVFAAQQAGVSRLFIRKLDQLQATAMAGTDGANNPFFSPDGQWIAFFAAEALKKVSVTGGAPVKVCESGVGRGGTWAEDDTIFFSPSGSPGANIKKVPAAGGVPAEFGTFSAGAQTQRWPQALPGGRGVLFTESGVTAAFDEANLVVMPLAGGAPKVVVRGGYFGRYAAGYLIYMQQGTLFGVRFDLSRAETVGQAVPVLEAVASNPGVGGSQVAFSSDGTLVYVPGTTVAGAKSNSMDWTTRDGKTSVLRSKKTDWGSPRFSPDGQKVALEISDGKQRDVWLYEWSRDTLTQLTFDPADDSLPVWSPDGRRIVFASDRAKKAIPNIYMSNADGTGDVTRLTDSPVRQLASSWHPSGKFLAFQQQKDNASDWDLMTLPMEGDASHGWRAGKATVFLSTPATELFPQFSPDGRWIAYSSQETGHSPEIYVRPFPGPGGKWRISTDGGFFPRWSSTAHELLFLQGFKVWFAPYTVVGDSFRADRPREWTPTALRSLSGYWYDIHPDGKRLAIAASSDQEVVTQDKVVFVSNFFEYLKKTVPGKK